MASTLTARPARPTIPIPPTPAQSILLTLTNEKAITDLGAYEFQPVDLCKNAIEDDINCDGIVNLLDQALLALHWLEMI